MHQTAGQQKRNLHTGSDFVKLGLQAPRLFALLNQALREHRQVEDLFAERVQQSRFVSTIHQPYRHLPLAGYFERNFFSILFQSIFISLNIPLARRLRYGEILHALRTLVTSADNILDKEQKGAVLLGHSEAGPVLKNILLILLSQTMIGRMIRELTENPEKAAEVENTLLDSLESIAAGESITSMQGKAEIPPPDELLRTVHEKIGGELLCLALAAPLKLETALQEPLQIAKQGVLAVGVALQMLDDVVDLEEDLRAEKTNLLASWIVHRARAADWKQLRKLVRSDAFSIEPYEPIKIDLMSAAIEKAMFGFSRLAQAGYPVKQKQTRLILKVLFRLRGLEKEWNQCADAAR